jgi:Ca2+-binding RTX toxin-like protein
MGGGAGDDELDLGQGSDTYLFTRGDGRDVLIDTGYWSSDSDTLRITGYTPDQVTVAYPYQDRDELLLRFADSDDEILLMDQYDTAAGRGIEQVVFSDGTTWDRAALVARISAAGSDTDDVIEGSDGEDLIIGAGGDDLLYGNDGSDTYRFALGDGHDVIEDNGWYDTDVVEFIGIQPGDLVLSRPLGDPGTLVIDLAGGGDRLTLLNTFDDDLRPDRGAALRGRDGVEHRRPAADGVGSGFD